MPTFPEDTEIGIIAIMEMTGPMRRNGRGDTIPPLRTRNDDLIFIGFTTKSYVDYIRYFKRGVSGADSETHREVNDYMTGQGLSKFYTRLFYRALYNDGGTRAHIVGLQNEHNSLFKYP